MSERLPHLIESQQFTPELLAELFASSDHARNIVRYQRKEDVISHELQGKLIATLFYKPSTRTRFSFESAIIRLGGNVISSENAEEFSSAAKGESIEDTVRVVGGYADAIVMRHGETGAAERAARASPVPIINAGDGSGQHPSQALLDMYTIQQELGRVDNLRVALVGDLAYGRTVRSLCYLLSKFPGNELVFVAPDICKMKDDIKAHLTEKGTKFTETDDLAATLPDVDVIYMTRAQVERAGQDAAKMRAEIGDRFSLTEGNLGLVKPKARILHPLPHVEEIQIPIGIEQSDPRIAYFRQAENGLYTRMALLKEILKK
jgi:aspartate carbamoyltransferase catalytic subunit